MTPLVVHVKKNLVFSGLIKALIVAAVFLLICMHFYADMEISS